MQVPTSAKSAYAAQLRKRLLGSEDIASELRELLPADLQGWGHDHDAFELMFSLLDIKVFLEVGTWKGMTSIRVAKEMIKRGIEGAIFCVDTWLGGEEHFGYRDMRRLAGYPRLYDQFLSNCVHEGVAPLIVPVPTTSHIGSVVLAREGIKADVIYVDASHEYADVLADLNDYFPLLKEGGLFIGDDYHASWPGVIRAAREFADKNDLRIYIWATKYFLQPKAVPPLAGHFLDVTDRPGVFYNGEAGYVG
ncbi:hypothetical protein sos41_14950 [Alphaproteobacteria bacterium SO-S41]|nr:hypothetical protein sos41_14950 [Alphaproteobacteria bacterium SO-S41]